jgi:apolipoprotein N-acyltransferase
MAVSGGLLNAAAFPGLGWWPLILIGTPFLLTPLIAARFPIAALSAVIGAAAFWGTHTFWLTVYLGAAPWLGLAGLQTVFMATAGVVIGFTWRSAERRARSATARLVLIPVAVGGLWTIREMVTGAWPYGGFAWGDLAYSQAESPLGELAAWTGLDGLTFLLAGISALTVQVIRDRQRLPRRFLALPAVVLAALVTVPAFPVEITGTMRIGAVQGNSEAGLLARNQPGRILQDHLAATAPLRGQDLDLLVWPENAADIDPLRSPDVAGVLDQLTAQVHAPVLVGTITADRERRFNSALLWEQGEGATAQYDKKHPVPFAEYLPDRDFWYPLAPDLFSLVPRDLSIGTRSNVMDIGGVRAGVAICFDIVDDALIREMVDGGAQLILAPTNNADFGRTDQSAQQLAIARMRAIESGRGVVNASTVGVSAMIGPDGAVINQLTPFAPGAMIAEVPLSSTITPAMAWATPLSWVIALLGVGGAITLGPVRRMITGGTSSGSQPRGPGSLRSDPHDDHAWPN